MGKPNVWSRVLIVDDHPGQLETLLKRMAGGGCEVLGYSTPTEAQSQIEQGSCGIAVLNLQMPGPTAHQLVEQLRHQNPAVKIILNKTFSRPDWPAETADSPDLIYVGPEVTPDQLLAHIRRAFQDSMIQYAESLEAVVHEKAVELQEERDQFRLFAEHLQEVLWIMTSDGARLVYVSPAYEALWGRTCDSLRQDPASLWQAIHPLDRPRVQPAFGVLKSEELKDECRVIRPDGSVRWVRMRIFPIQGRQPEIVRMAGTAEDITEHKRVEEALTKSERHFRQSSRMEAIGTLAGGIAHDFNNILTAILGYTELALATVPKDSRTQRNLQEVLTAGHRAKHLVQQILTFSRQSGPGKKSLPLHTIVREALKLLRATIPSTITIQQTIATDAIILAEPTQIHQMLINLCTNAEYAMREEGGVLQLILEDVEVTEALAQTLTGLPVGPYVRLTVRDTGTGMSPEILERMFDPFFTTKPIGEGSGMGLAVVHGIVTAHGGTICVDSRLGHGTKVEVYLPRAQAPAWDHLMDQGPIPVGRETILFVDDEETIVRLGQELLTSLGYTVEVETRSPEALAKFKQDPHRFDLVITDQTMPSMTGEALSRELLRIRPDLPIILCTGFSHIMSAEKAKALGIKAYLMKPLAIRDLAPIVRHVLDKAPSPLAET